MSGNERARALRSNLGVVEAAMAAIAGADEIDRLEREIEVDKRHIELLREELHSVKIERDKLQMDYACLLADRDNLAAKVAAGDGR